MSFRCLPLARRRGSVGDWRAWPGDAAAVVTSVLVHALVLLALVRPYRPIQPLAARQDTPRPEVLLIEFPPLNRASPAVRTVGDPPGAERSPHPSPRAAELPRMDAGVAGERMHAPVLDESQSPAATTPSTPHAGSSPSSPFQTGFRDLRLYTDTRSVSLAAPHPLHERLEADARAAIRAHQDSTAEQRSRALAARQTTILGRRVTVLGDSTAYHRAGLRHDIVGQKIIMPGDGREWEDAQLKKQEQDRDRDSILRERVRATRERRDAERGAGRHP